MSKQSKRVLHYDTTGRDEAWRTKLSRWRVPCAVLSALAAFALLYFFWSELEEAYWHHRCMVYTQSPDRVIYEDDPVKMKTLRALDDRYWPTLYGEAVTYNSESWLEMRKERVLADIAFMHERTGHADNHRLVVVYFNEIFVYDHKSRERSGLKLTGCSLLPSETFHSATLNPQYTTIPHPHGVMRMFAGQCDLKDESHFTIRYEIDKQPCMIDGWLQSDDTVRLQFRTQKTTQGQKTGQVQ